MNNIRKTNKLFLVAIIIILILVLLVYVVCVALIGVTADKINTRKNVSALHLITNPEKYNNKNICFVGNVVKEGRNFYLFPSQESKMRFNIKDAIILNNTTYLSTESECIRGKGNFNALESCKTAMAFNSSLEAWDIRTHIKTQSN